MTADNKNDAQKNDDLAELDDEELEILGLKKGFDDNERLTLRIDAQEAEKYQAKKNKKSKNMPKNAKKIKTKVRQLDDEDEDEDDDLMDHDAIRSLNQLHRMQINRQDSTNSDSSLINALEAAERRQAHGGEERRKRLLVAPDFVEQGVGDLRGRPPRGAVAEGGEDGARSEGGAFEGVVDVVEEELAARRGGVVRRLEEGALQVDEGRAPFLRDFADGAVQLRIRAQADGVEVARADEQLAGLFGLAEAFCHGKKDCILEGMTYIRACNL